MAETVIRTIRFPGRLDADLVQLADSRGVTVEQLVSELLCASPVIQEKINTYLVRLSCEYSITVRAISPESALAQVNDQFLDRDGKPFPGEWQESWSELELDEES